MPDMMPWSKAYTSYEAEQKQMILKRAAPPGNEKPQTPRKTPKKKAGWSFLKHTKTTPTTPKGYAFSVHLAWFSCQKRISFFEFLDPKETFSLDLISKYYSILDTDYYTLTLNISQLQEFYKVSGVKLKWREKTTHRSEWSLCKNHFNMLSFSVSSWPDLHIQDLPT